MRTKIYILLLLGLLFPASVRADGQLRTAVRDLVLALDDGKRKTWTVEQILKEQTEIAGDYERNPKGYPPGALLEVALAYAYAEQGDKALAVLKKVIKARPKDPLGFQFCGVVHMAAGRSAEAARYFKK